MALYRFEQHLGAGLLNIPDRAVQLAQDTVQVLYLAQAGRPLAWCPSAHRHFPVRFRDDVRRLLAAMYAGRGQSQNPKPPGEGGDLGEAFALFKALPEATLRQRVVFEVVASMARTTVWKALPPEFWTSCGHQDRGGHIETGELL